MQGAFLLLVIVFGFVVSSYTYYGTPDYRQSVTPYNRAPEAVLLQHSTFVRWAAAYMVTHPTWTGTASWQQIVNDLDMPAGHRNTEMPADWKLVADVEGYVICASVRNEYIPAMLANELASTTVTTTRISDTTFVVGYRDTDKDTLKKEALKCGL